MLRIPRHQVVGARNIGTLQELVIAGVSGHLNCVHRRDAARVAPDELEKLLTEALAGPRTHKVLPVW